MLSVVNNCDCMEIDNIYNLDCAVGIRKLPNGYKYCIVTDPPFNIKYHYNEYNDNKEENEYYDWLCGIVNNFPCVVVHYPEKLYKLSFHLMKFPERVVSWVYNSNTPRQHRDIAFFDVKPDFYKVKQPYKNTNDKRIAARIAAGCDGGKMYDWFEINQVKNVSKEKQKVCHPCQMPVDVMRIVIALLPDDYVIIDQFLGSGTTAIAAIKEKRHYIGFELNKEYYEIACNRIKEELQQIKLF